MRTVLVVMVAIALTLALASLLDFVGHALRNCDS